MRPFVGVGIAAAVAIAAVIALRSANETRFPVEGVLDATPLQAGQWTEPPSYVVPQDASESGPVAPPIRLTNYLMRHGEVAYFDGMVERELVDTEAAQDVIGALRDPAAPPLRWLRDGVWRLVRWPYARAGALATIGLLPPVLRERLGVRWSASKQLRFRALTRLSRASGPLMPPQARSFGPNYLRWRGPAIAR